MSGRRTTFKTLSLAAVADMLNLQSYENAICVILCVPQFLLRRVCLLLYITDLFLFSKKIYLSKILKYKMLKKAGNFSHKLNTSYWGTANQYGELTAVQKAILMIYPLHLPLGHCPILYLSQIKDFFYRSNRHLHRNR